MTEKPALHVLFTMNCEPTKTKAAPDGPKSWEQSARAMEGFCNRVLSAGYPVTLFLSPGCAEQHTPLLEELQERDVELGLHVHPPALGDRRFKRSLGRYGETEQRAIIETSLARFEAALGGQPRSFRPGKFSASDATFPIVYQLGFRQGSVSSPGSDARREGAVWPSAEEDAHLVDPEDRLAAGAMPFLEVPLTTDPTQKFRGGFTYDLCLENGRFEEWHRPVAECHLQRMAEQDASFRTLCILAHNSPAYHRDDDVPSATLELLLDYLATLEAEYELVATTLTGTHARFRRLSLVT